MMTLLRSISMALSMFSKIPVPQVEWKKENMKYMLCALPLVGIAIGIVLIIWNMFCGWAHIGSFLYAAGMTFIPLAISGGIHMDGYADTIDALSSHAAPEKKRQILKDSHAGAFAIIYTAAYLIVYCAFASELVIGASTGIFILMCHVFARCIGAFAGTAFPGSGHEGLLASFRDGATRKAVLIISIFCIICCIIMVWLFPQGGIACIVSAILLLLYLKKMSIKEFGGMSGDLAGFIITISELVFTACFAISFKVVCL